MVLDGKLQDDGTGLLIADGLTGAVDYTINHVPKTSPFHYHVDAKFDKASGQGTRREMRPCLLDFTKN
jgi:hypothetical protein